MDASCKIQGSIHVFRLVNNMCPGKWVHISDHGACNLHKCGVVQLVYGSELRTAVSIRGNLFT